MKIGIFCSANNDIDPDFFALTEELGRWMAENNHQLVYGGCESGLMSSIGYAVHNNGGMAIGVVPSKIEEGNMVAKCLDVDIPVANLADRKEIMTEKSDVVIALPGGVGTLDEVFSVVAGNTIGYHKKRVILYNMKGFWNSLLSLLDDLQQRGMIRGDYHDMITSANNLDEIKQILGS